MLLGLHPRHWARRRDLQVVSDACTTVRQDASGDSARSISTIRGGVPFTSAMSADRRERW